MNKKRRDKLYKNIVVNQDNPDSSLQLKIEELIQIIQYQSKLIANAKLNSKEL